MTARMAGRAALLACAVAAMLAAPAGAAVSRYVDAFGQCPTSGTAATRYTTIQDAVNAANAGDYVRVCAGVYEGPVEIDKKLFVLSQPAHRAQVNVAEGIPGSQPVGFLVRADGARIDGFLVKGFGAFCDVPLSNPVGIQTFGSGNLVTNNRITGAGCSSSGITADESPAATTIVDRNTIAGVLLGVGVGTQTAVNEVDRINVTGTTITGPALDTPEGIGISAFGALRGQIRANTATNLDTGIRVGQVSGPYGVLGNRALENATGILLTLTTGVTVGASGSGNRVTHNEQVGIRADSSGTNRFAYNVAVANGLLDCADSGQGPLGLTNTWVNNNPGPSDGTSSPDGIC